MCRALATHLKQISSSVSTSKSIISIQNLNQRSKFAAFLSKWPEPVSGSCSGFAKKGFLEIPTLTSLKIHHAIFLKNTMYCNVFTSNTLLTMYFKFGEIKCAARVFEEKSVRNAASWNAMVSGFVKMGLFVEAMGVFLRMQGECVRLNGFVVASLVTGCDRSGWMVKEGLQLHGLVEKSGLGRDIYVGTTIVHFYGSYGLVLEARRFFEAMPKRNVVSWTALMVSFSKNGLPKEALLSYKEMRKEGADCNQNTFATVVSSCGLLENELLGLQVIGHVIVSGYESEVSVGNSMIILFGLLEKIECAELTFRKIELRDAISWNSMLSVYSRGSLCEQAMSCFSEMRNSGVKPDASTLCSLMTACDSVDLLRWGRGLHAYVGKTGLDFSVSVCNSLVNMYTTCARYDDAKLKFNEIPDKDVISWNTMISCCVQNRQYTDALRVLSQLLHTNHALSHVTFASALASCVNSESLRNGKLIHGILIQTGLQENLMLINALITMYCNCNEVNEAKRVFSVSPEVDVISWNALIGGYVDNEEKDLALKYFHLMRESGAPTNYITMVNILGICNDPSDLLNLGKPLHAHMITSGFEFDGFVKNSILAMYSRCGDLMSSNSIFDALVHRSVVSWNAIISAKAHHGQGEEALMFFKELRYSGLDLDQFSLSGGLSACASVASLKEGQQLHGLVLKLGFASDVNVTNAAMDMYGKCGKMDNVIKLHQTIPPSRHSWNIMLSGYARHGYFKEVKETFHEMLQAGVRPDHVTFVSLLAVCNHAGFVDEGLHFFSCMTSEFGVSPTMEHCVCMVDLLGRAGRLLEAENFINDMPVSPNDVIWRSLLASSRIHGNLEVGRKAAEQLVNLDPLDDSAYVLLSNVCAINSKWQDVQQVRTLMKSINLKKKPACSWI